MKTTSKIKTTQNMKTISAFDIHQKKEDNLKEGDNTNTYGPSLFNHSHSCFMKIYKDDLLFVHSV